MSDPPTFNHDDREYLGELFTTHHSHLDNVLKRYIWDEHVREDFVHEVFVLVLRKWHKYDRQQPFWPWLYPVALNYLFSEARKKKWRPHVTNVEDLESLIGADGEACEEPPLEALIRSEDSQRIRDRVEALPPELRTTVILRYWEEKSGPEIAVIMQVPVGSVYRRMYEAHRLLEGT
jgi:RNA polymerase sigma-70 factor (ECF subfamily)